MILFDATAAADTAIATIPNVSNNKNYHPHFRISAASRLKSEIAVVLEFSKNQKKKHPFFKKVEKKERPFFLNLSF